jgi:dsRNA-specific ribonuclease
MFSIEVHVNGKCLGKGYGASKHAAQEDAARNALDALEMNGSDSPDL